MIDRDVIFEDSDHHQLTCGDLHQRLYPRPGENVSEILVNAKDQCGMLYEDPFVSVAEDSYFRFEYRST